MTLRWSPGYAAVDEYFDNVSLLGENQTRVFDVSGNGNNGTTCLATYLLGINNTTLYPLRQFRDEVLAKNPVGRMFIDLYYGYSAIIIKIFNRHPAIKEPAKHILE